MALVAYDNVRMMASSGNAHRNIKRNESGKPSKQASPCDLRATSLSSRLYNRATTGINRAIISVTRAYANAP